MNAAWRNMCYRGTLLAGLAACGMLSGCGLLVEGLSAGTYAGELACRASVAAPDGMEGTEDYTMAVTLVVDADGGLTVNDEPIVVSEMVTRALPNADLSFEVVTVSQEVGQVDVTYAPRPTLPGIEVTGDLVENYEQNGHAVQVTGRAELVLTDVSGDSMIDVDCSGTLPRQ